MCHFQNEEKTEESCKYAHVVQFVAPCSYANTSSQTLNTGMSEDGCPAVHVRWFDR